jgi:hypothetical protein
VKPIAIFFHTVFFGPDGNALPWSVRFNDRYMKDLTDSGLMDAQEYFVAGINGGAESIPYAQFHLPKARHLLHGVNCQSSNLTSEAMRTFCVTHPGWNILHFHCKGVAHHMPNYAGYLAFEERWIACMVNACIYNWRTCVADLETHDAVGCHWMENVGSPPVDHIFGGTFWWATSDFIATKPPLSETPLVKQFGMVHYESRATSEQYIGIGPRLPKVKDYCAAGIGSHM